MPDVATILVSASVAATVTLLIEYSAKPMLEVRKDRIVQHARDRENARKQLVTLVTQFEDVRFDVEMNPLDPLAVLVRLSDEFRQVSSRRGDIGINLPGEMRLLLNWELGYCAAILNTSGSLYREHRHADPKTPYIEETLRAIVGELHGHFSIAIAYLDTPAWRLLARRRLVKRASEEYGKTEEGAKAWESNAGPEALIGDPQGAEAPRQTGVLEG